MTIADAAKRPDKKTARAVPARRSAFRLSASPSHLLRRVEQFAAEIYLRSELPGGVTLRQAVLLAAIAEAEGASQSDLVGATGVDRSTLAEMMGRMERKGLIARSAAEDDGRAKAVSLTNEGRRRLEAALPATREVDRALLAALPKSSRQAFVATLAALAAAADQQHAANEDADRQARKDARDKKAKAPAKRAKVAARKKR
jgi:DNA-binding MarR family transcriptional regulator